jgi:hypothetical protein
VKTDRERESEIMKLRIHVKRNGVEEFCSEWQEGIEEDQIETTVVSHLVAWNLEKFSSIEEYMASLPDLEEGEKS